MYMYFVFMAGRDDNSFPRGAIYNNAHIRYIIHPIRLVILRWLLHDILRNKSHKFKKLYVHGTND